MTFADYLLELFYLVDTQMQGLGLSRLRRRGPQPRLHDSEVITMELAGEFLGIDADKAIWQHFRRYHLAEFPALAGVDRTRFVRQAADLWRVKQRLHERVAAMPPADDPALPDAGPLWIVDSFPLRVCRFKRAPSHRLFRGLADYGRDPTDGRLFYGFRVHLRCTQAGGCAQILLTAANVPDVNAVAELTRGLATPTTVIGDRNYWSPQEQQTLRDQGVDLTAPFRKKSRDPDPAAAAVLSRLRQVIEPVIGQLATRLNAQRTRGRDLWHLTSRLTRKLLSHTIALWINARQGHPPTQLALLIND